MSEDHSKQLLEALRVTPTSTTELQSLLGSLQYSRSAFVQVSHHYGVILVAVSDNFNR